MLSKMPRKQQTRKLVQNLKTVLMNNKRKFLDLVIVAVILTLLSHGLFAVGLPAGTDLLLLTVDLEFSKRLSMWFSVWTPLDSFGFPISLGTQFNFILFLFSLIPDVVLTTKLYVYASLLLAGFVMYFFVYHHTKHHNGSLAAAIVYVLNPVFIAEVYDGHHSMIFGYAIAPLAFLAYDRALISGKMRDIMLSGVILSTLFIGGHPQTTYIFGAFLLLFAFLEILVPRKGMGRRSSFKRVFKTSCLLVIFLVVLSAYEILPAMLNVMKSSVLFNLGYTIEEAYDYSGRIKDFLLISLPFLIFLTFLLRKNKYAFFFSLSSFISTLIAVGPHPPLGYVFIWAFMNIPLFNIFRVPYRFLLMTMFSLSFLIGFAISKKNSSGQKHVNLGFPQESNKHILYRASSRMKAGLKVLLGELREGTWRPRAWRHIALVAAGMVIGSSLYVAYGEYGYSLGTYTLPVSYIDTYEWIRERTGDYRVLTVPYPAHYVSTSLLVGINRGWTWDPPVYSQVIHGKVVVTGIGGTIDTSDFLDFWGTQMVNHRTDDLMNVLATFNIRYIMLHPYQTYSPPRYLLNDTLDLTEHERTFFSFQKGLKTVYQSDNVTVLENDYWIPQIYATQNCGLIIGGRDVFTSLLEVETFNLSQRVLIFAHQIDYRTFDELLDTADMMVLSSGGFTDLVFMSLSDGIRIKASQYAFPSSDPSKYWIQSKWWTDQGKLVINRLSLRTEGPNWLDIPFNTPSRGDYVVFGRVAFAPDRGNLSVLMDGSPLACLVPHANAYNGFKWVELGSIRLDEGRHILRLWNDGLGVNDIDEVVILPRTVFTSKVNEVKKVIEASSARILYIVEAENVFTYQDLDDWSVESSYEASNGYALAHWDDEQSGQLSGDVFLPKSGEYMLGVRVLGGTVGEITINIDNCYRFIIPSSNLTLGWKWVSLGPINLEAGEHEMLIGSTRESQLDELIFYSSNQRPIPVDEVFEIRSDASSDYKQVSPYEYKVRVNTEKVFFLVFSESYHPLWKVYLDAEEIPALPAYSFSNAFYISKIGNYDLTIEFVGQNYVVYGSIISIASVVCFAVYLAFGEMIGSFIAKKVKREGG